MMAGQVAGAGLGLLADHQLKLTPGEVSLANSGALWTGVASLLGRGALSLDEGEHADRRFMGVTLGTTSLAMVGAGWLARKDNVSRGRALMVDVGAIAGGGAFPLVAWLVGGDDVQDEALLWSAMAGALSGAAVSYVLTRHWDAPELPPVSLSVSPTEGGAIGQVTLKL